LKEAAGYLEQAYRMSLTTDDTISWARTLDNWGYVQSMAGDYSGLSKMEEALQMRLEINDIKGLYAGYFHLAEHYIRLGDTLNALDYAEKAKAVAYRMNAPSNIQDALNRYLRLSGTRETKRYIALNDSLQKATQEEANRFAALRYDAVSAEARAKEVELEAERQRRSKLIYQATGALVVLSAIFLFILFRNRHKREKAAQVSETEARISKKVHDEVANDIHLLLTQLESSGKVDEVFLQRLDEVYNRTRNISKEVAGVDPDTNFGLQLAGLLKTYRSEQVQVITRNLDGIDWEQFDLLKKNTLYRVVQELMTNMRKHSKASVVALIFEQEGKRLSVSYRDNGVGAQLNDKGGLQNTENRMEAVGGTISFETEPGKGFNAKLVL
jgi:signal transduction histidine kinase